MDEEQEYEYERGIAGVDWKRPTKMKERDAREGGICHTVDDDGRCRAERRLAKLGHERGAHADHLDGRQRLVDDAHVGSVRSLRVLQRARQHDVLLRDEPHGDAVADGGVEEMADLFRGHVLGAFLKPAPKKKKNKVGVVLLNRSFLSDARVCERGGDEIKLTLSQSLVCRSRGHERVPPAAQQTLRFLPNSSPEDTPRSTGSFS